MALPSTLENELRESFEKVVCKELDSTYIEKDTNGNYISDYIQNEWMKNLNLFRLLNES